jgi:CDP-2,3-bis-(O-geranylgeranyl)-sn-glycerol synthase
MVPETGIYSEAVKLFLFLLPLYFANGSAMLLGGKMPLDLGRKWRDGMPVFGAGKTFRGSFMGVFVGTGSAAVVYLFYPAADALYGNYLFLAFLLSLGAIIGDITASFFKRRNGIKRGNEVLFLDQLDFAIGGMLLGSLVYTPSFYEIAAVSVITLLMHKLSNFLAYHLKLKKVPW